MSEVKPTHYMPRSRRLLMLMMCWLIVGVTARSALALDPQKTITQFVHTSWTEKDGAPTGTRSITQTADGYLWLGTVSGSLYRFDGVRFVRFEPQAGESLPETRLLDLFATRDGALWITYIESPAYRLFNGHLSKVENLPNVYQFAEAPDGTLVAGTVKGLWRLKDGVWSDVSTEWNFPGKQARRLNFGKSGTLWVRTENQLVYLPPGERQFVDTGQSSSMINFAEAPDGNVWVSETGRSAHSLPRRGDAGPITEVRVGATWVFFDRNGSLWVTSAGDGIRRVADPGKIKGLQVAQFGPEAEQFTVKEGLSGNLSTAILEDREGNIWVTTFKGLDRFRESPFVTVPIDQPDSIRYFQTARDGTLFVASAGGTGVQQISPLGNIENLPHVVNASIGGMCEDENGIIWAFDTQAFYKFQQGSLVPVPLPGGVKANDFNSIECDRVGGIWLYSLDSGLWRLANGVLTKLVENHEQTPRVSYPYADREDRIWLGEMNRVWLYDHGKSQVFETKDGVPAGLIFSFFMDRAGGVWAGGESGLSKFENGRFRSVSKSNGLSARIVYGIAEDDDSCLWLAGDSGVLRVPIVELNRALTDPNHLLHYESFDALDGLPGKPAPVQTHPTIARTLNGRIWFATTNGIAYVDPQRIPKNNLPPPVQVESLSANSRDYGPWDTLKLPARTTNLQITYTALSLTIPERIRFRYQLEGVDNNWQEAGARRVVSYSNLGPGNYRFRVIASNNDSVWNEVGTTLNFSILPAWYQTIWFRMLYFVLGLFFIWMLYRLRLRQVSKAMSIRFNERLVERTRIARELHDTLLQTVQGGKLVADHALEKPDDARHLYQALSQLSGWLGQATQEGRAALNSLRTSSEDDLATGLRRATEECVIGQSMAVKFSITGSAKDLHPIVRDEIYRIGYEAIRNACEHSSANELEVSLRYAQDLTLRVKDNGAGIEAAVLTDGKPGHFGLQGMRERAQRIGSKFTLNSSPNSGTEITLIVPGNIIFRKPSTTLLERIKTLVGLDNSTDLH